MSKTPTSSASVHVFAADALVKEAEAAAFLGLAVQTLRNDRGTQRLGIPFYKLGTNAVRYRPSDLERWLAKRRVEAPEAPA